MQSWYCLQIFWVSLWEVGHWGVQITTPISDLLKSDSWQEWCKGVRMVGRALQLFVNVIQCFSGEFYDQLDLGITAPENIILFQIKKNVDLETYTSSMCMIFAFHNTSQASRTTNHETSALFLELSLLQSHLYFQKLCSHVRQTEQRLLESKPPRLKIGTRS